MWSEASETSNQAVDKDEEGMEVASREMVIKLATLSAAVVSAIARALIASLPLPLLGPSQHVPVLGVGTSNRRFCG